MQTTVSVSGMTCDHCERRVSTEVASIPGINDAQADHVTGSVTFTSDEPVDVAAVREAVEEAGYDLADA